jgi:hypothetical protein
MFSLLLHRDADVHVVVVMGEDLHDARGPGKSRVWANEDELRSRGDETVDQVLSKTAIDLGRLPRLALAPVAARVVDVDVQAVLMGGVTETAEAFAEIPSVATTEIPDTHARRVRMFRSVRSQNVERNSNETTRCEAPVGAVG